MPANSSVEMMSQTANADTADPAWKGLYKLAGGAALIVVLAGLLDTFIMFLPGTGVTPRTLTVTDWFTLYQANWFLGLRNFGFLNIVTMTSMVPVFLALYAAHRRANQAYAALAAILLFIGTTVYIANNKALAMLTLSGQYAAATTESQRSLLAAAGQAMLAQEDLTAGAFLGFFFVEVAAIAMAVVMLRSNVFSRLTALVGILGEGLLLIFNVCAAFVPSLYDVAMIFAMSGALLTMAWCVLLARRLFQLGQGESAAGAREAQVQLSAG